MDRAREITTGRIVHANAGGHHIAYTCPVCKARVHYRGGRTRRPHFAHNPGEGRPECKLYVPGSGVESVPPPSRETILPLQLFLAADSTIEPFVELVPIALSRWGDADSSDSSTPRVQVGNDRSAPVFSALDLRPGSGRNAAAVPLPEADVALHQTGRLPRRAAEQPSRLSALPPTGTLFVRRLGGSFRRHDAQWCPLYWGDQVIVLANRAVHPPRGLDNARLPDVLTEYARWHAALVSLPSEETIAARYWLNALGAEVEGPHDRPRLISVPTGYAPDGTPRYTVRRPVAVATPGTGTTVATDHQGSRIEHGRPDSGLINIRASRPIENVRVEHPDRVPFTRFEVERETSTRADRHIWSVIIDGRPIAPHSRTKLSAPPRSITVSTAWEGLTFTAQVHNQNGDEQVHSLDAAAVTAWLKTRWAKAARITVDAGNLGAIAIEHAAPLPSCTRPGGW